LSDAGLLSASGSSDVEEGGERKKEREKERERKRERKRRADSVGGATNREIMRKDSRSWSHVAP
jgi:hypothetical protein